MDFWANTWKTYPDLEWSSGIYTLNKLPGQFYHSGPWIVTLLSQWAILKTAPSNRCKQGMFKTGMYSYSMHESHLRKASMVVIRTQLLGQTAQILSQNLCDFEQVLLSF